MRYAHSDMHAHTHTYGHTFGLDGPQRFSPPPPFPRSPTPRPRSQLLLVPLLHSSVRPPEISQPVKTLSVLINDHSSVSSSRYIVNPEEPDGGGGDGGGAEGGGGR